LHYDADTNAERGCAMWRFGARSCLAAGLAALATLAWSAADGPGQRDFDFEIGAWKTQLSRRVKPLSGSDTWVRYEGTTLVRKVWDGDANLVELDVTGPAGRIEGLSLRLYDPATAQWSLNFASKRGGGMSPPVTGGFKDGRGEFFGDDTLGDKPIRVRFVISDITRDRCRFEQAFSADGGKTWEVNWIAVDTRIADPGATAR
jgi:hypothetical protein